MKSIIILFLVLLLALLSLGWYNSYTSQKSIQRQNMSALADTLRISKNKYGKWTAEKKTFLFNEQELKDHIKVLDSNKLDLEKQLKRFKKKTVIITRTEFKIDTLKIPVNKQGNFRSETKWYTIKGQLKDSLQIDLLKFENTQGLIFGEKKGKWFKPNFITAQITNTNPYIQVKGLESYSIPVQTKKNHIGVHLGVGITTILTPQIYIGIGYTRSIWSF